MAGTEKIPVSDTQYITPAQIMANHLPLAGGSMDSDAYIAFSDYDNVYNAAVTYDGLHAERTYNSVRYKLDAVPNYLAIYSGSDHARYKYDSILRRLNGTDYNINLPSAAGTLALTSDIPTVPTNVSAFTNDANYVKYVLCADQAAYNAIANKDSGTLYLIPKTS
jgi:hypothetical protein